MVACPGIIRFTFQEANIIHIHCRGNLLSYLFRFRSYNQQLTWPHADTDWAYMLEEVQQCFIAIASEIAKRELLLIVTPEPEEVRKVMFLPKRT